MVTLKATPREKEFFTYLARGMTTEEIRRIMEVSPEVALKFRLNLLTKNRYPNAFRMVCAYYFDRVELLKSRNEELKHKLSETRKELRYYRNATKRRKRKDNS